MNDSTLFERMMSFIADHGITNIQYKCGGIKSLNRHEAAVPVDVAVARIQHKLDKLDAFEKQFGIDPMILLDALSGKDVIWQCDEDSTINIGNDPLIGKDSHGLYLEYYYALAERLARPKDYGKKWWFADNVSKEAIE